MKNLNVLFIAFFTVLPIRAANDPYLDNMVIAKAMADTATVENTLVMAANYFLRIAAMNPGKWLPHYYSAYCYARISLLNHEETVRDLWVDKAQTEIDKAISLEPENAENLVMKGFVLQARMNINPMARGYRYNDETMGYFNKAREVDPENPRAYLWQGVNVLHTPEMFGGGKEKACPLLKQANEKFRSFSPVDSIAPDWGRTYAKEMLKRCQ